MADVDCPEYMLVRLDRIGVWDLCWLLICEHKRFTDTHDKKGFDETFFRRFIIFITILAMKGIIMISTILKGLRRLVKFFLGTNYDYLSNFIVTRSKDTRVDLDDKISREDPRYKSALASMAAKTAYENEDRVREIVEHHWKMEFVGFYNCSNDYVSTQEFFNMSRPTEAFIFSDKTGDHDVIWVSFRGTSLSSANDMCTNLDLSWYRLRGIGKVHAGFLKALGLQKDKDGRPSWPKELKRTDNKTFAYYEIRKVLQNKLKENEDARFIVTGHSLGGALAVLFPAILGFHNEVELLEKLEGVYTFGQPRVGDREFCEFMERKLGARRYFRFVYGYDVVPRVPLNDVDFGFEHFGHCWYFNSLYSGKVMKDHPNNYIIPKPLQHFNAVFEFVRTLILPYVYGTDYKEGFDQIGIRVLGIVFPGLSAHGVHNYVNLTRLGSPHNFFALLDQYHFNE